MLVALTLLALAFVAAAAGAAWRMHSLLPATQRKAGTLPKPRRRSKSEQCCTAIMLGSGGHTAEALQLVSALDPARYTPRLYLVSQGDVHSAERARKLEARWGAGSTPEAQEEGGTYEVVVLPRARAVHQSFLTAPLSVVLSLGACLKLFVWPVLRQRIARRSVGGAVTTSKRQPELFIMNGPGTCVPLVMAVYVLRFFALPSPTLLYVESFARVKSLSLTAKLVRPFVDRFVVQWPEAGGAEYVAPASCAAKPGDPPHKWWLV